jgi:hypothetical protein
MMEYKIIAGSPKNCQMKLNQWKHDYKLEILQMSANEKITVILLTRTPKEKTKVPF